MLLSIEPDLSYTEQLLPPLGMIEGFIEIGVRMLKWYDSLTYLQQLYFNYNRVAEKYNELLCVMDLHGYIDDNMVTLP